MTAVNPRGGQSMISPSAFESWSNCSENKYCRTLDATLNGELTPCPRQADSQLSTSFFLLLLFYFTDFLLLHPSFQFWTSKGDHFSRQWFLPISHLLVSCVFSNSQTDSPMGLQSCKPCNSCPQSKKECTQASFCNCVCENWRYCFDQCCDICCQMCVAICSGLCKNLSALSAHPASVRHKTVSYLSHSKMREKIRGTK